MACIRDSFKGRTEKTQGGECPPPKKNLPSHTKLHSSCLLLLPLTVSYYLCDDKTLHVLCPRRDFDLQLRPDTELFHPDFTLTSGTHTIRKHGMKSYFYSGFDRSEYSTCSQTDTTPISYIQMICPSYQVHPSLVPRPFWEGEMAWQLP